MARVLKIPAFEWDDGECITVPIENMGMNAGELIEAGFLETPHDLEKLVSDANGKELDGSIHIPLPGSESRSSSPRSTLWFLVASCT